MRSFARLSGSIGVAALAALALAPAAQAQAAAADRIVPIPCSLSALDTAITQANLSLVATTIQFPIAACTITIFTPAVPGSGLPVITGNVTLAGSQNDVITRDFVAPPFRILTVAATGTLTVEKVTISDGLAILNGGAISNAGTLHVDRSTVTGNTASNGGAIENAVGATATITRTLLNQNSAALSSGGAIVNAGDLTLFGDTIDSNFATLFGGGLYTGVTGDSDIFSTTFTNNTAGSEGGGLFNIGDTSLDGSQVRLNSASSGGGIFSTNLLVTLTTSIVRDNTPDNCVPLFSGCS